MAGRGRALRRALAEALSGHDHPVSSNPTAEMEAVFRELYDLESRTREATDMLERSARERPEMADLLNVGIRCSDPDGAAIPADVAEHTAVDALVHALVPAPAAAGEA